MFKSPSHIGNPAATAPDGERNSASLLVGGSGLALAGDRASVCQARRCEVARLSAITRVMLPADNRSHCPKRPKTLVTRRQPHPRTGKLAQLLPPRILAVPRMQ